MKKLVEDWKKNTLKREDENFRFIRYLKNKDRSYVDRLAREIHIKTFNEIDCLECGNCCKTARPCLSESDIKKIAKHLSKSIKEIKNEFLEIDDEKNWRFNKLPCPFLEPTNECGIYEVRPKDCREYPHTDKELFASRSYGTSHNTTVCPAAFAIVERMKNRMNYYH